MPSEENDDLLRRYRKEAEKMRSVVFVGRLADYRYYNMDQAVARALHVFETTLSDRAR